MKIASITRYSLPHQLGGVEFHVNSLAKELVKVGNRVHVFTTTDNVIQKYIGKPRVIMKDGYLVHYSRSSLMGKINPDLKDFDIIHIHNYNRFLADYLIKKWSEKPIVITLHGGLWGPFYENGITPLLKVLHDKFLTKLMLKRVTKLIALSESEKKFLMETFSVKEEMIDVIPNGLSQKVFENSKKLPEVSKINSPYICTIARLSKRKCIDHVIKAMPKLPKDIYYVIIGPKGGELKNLKSLVAELDVESRIYFVGQISNEEKYALVRNSLAFILPSWFEMQPISILESMSLGVPVIATNVGGVPDIIKHGKTGLLYNWGDLKKLEEWILKLYESKNMRARISKKAKAYSSKFRWSKVAKRVNATYREIAC